ncbi:DMT family transporter [Pseudonocardia kunmingensis]|uniref:EamA-like transporter family protein n=1 Tax=Pseudonocardia kunmingensis TaxID=630975 RepID=A0A543DL15_9PSEU|nr:DMT family transporter [Pseudonocardia kunmingensis]TQM10019.1 EamA-like transporter family protein [Pseudonocardia kunmingensis]
MTSESSASRRAAVTGSALGAVGVLGFSMSMPATRAAVADLDPWLVAFGRSVGAGLLAVLYLRLRRAPRPSAAQCRRLAVVAAGVVVGFPLFTSLALTATTAAHGGVVVAVLPALTAVFAVLRARERPPALFWLAGGAGLAVVVAFTVVSGSATGALEAADVFLLAAVVLCALGYAEGGAVAREIGGANTICSALVLSLPVTVTITALVAVQAPPHAGPVAWTGFAYLTLVSMFLAFFAWYAGLARGGIARVGQIQLVQPLLTLGWAALLLGETVTVSAIGVALAVLLCVVLTQRTRSIGIRSAPGRAVRVG